VQLREDQYDKLKRWNCLCDIYVNHLGDVCIRKFERVPPHGGTVFAQTSWSPVQPLDKVGYPIFQNTRGVCAKILGAPPPVTANSPISKLYHQTSLAVRSLFLKKRSSSSGGGSEDADVVLTDLMAKRHDLYGDLTRIERKYNTGQELQQQLERNQKAIEQNLQLIELYSAQCETPNGNAEVNETAGTAVGAAGPGSEDKNFQTTYAYYRKSIDDLKKANEQMRLLDQSLREKLASPDVSMDPETFLVEKEKVKKELDTMKVLIKDHVRKNTTTPEKKK
jgi:hypothetical protein